MDKGEVVKRITGVEGVDVLNPIQLKMLSSDAKDIVLIAPTGSGKTLAFGIKILQRLSKKEIGVQALVVVPSRELALQIGRVLRQVAKDFKIVELYGGHSVADETASLSPTPSIIVATPGRLLDHLQRGTIILPQPLGMLVLDEYDKALQLGFEGEMKRIIKRIGVPNGIVLTSATKLDKLPDYLGVGNPLIIKEVNEDDSGRIETVCVESYSNDKLDTLVALLRNLPMGERVLVFVNHRESADRVYERIKREHIPAVLYYGSLDQQDRLIAIDLFSNGTCPVMVATDLAARGLDIPEIESVIHYHLPVDKESWIHRNGRTARQGAKGVVYVIASEKDDISDYISFDRTYQPSTNGYCGSAMEMGSLYFDMGRKEKISKGDILGFILANSSLEARQVGKIYVHDHFAIAAVPRAAQKELVSHLNKSKLKGKRVRVSVKNEVTALKNTRK